ncbi:unnamed protein product [Phytophthora lilii]|uniref:Unnamed protein product n=1 Tax=Phytophthora lilii TaxID=2077276 RepID=A0A9W6XND8_9STRA|nr:unnamed protein product [Phytophthora lilii]
MPFLQVLHLGVPPTLPRVPPLNGVPSLQSLTLAGLYLVTEIPSFEKVPKLQRLMLPHMDSLQTIPDMAPLKNLASFMIMSICPACCNGFIGHCDPTDWFCVGNPDIGVAASTCLAGNTSQPTSATASMLQRFAPTVCIRSGFDLSKTVELLSRDQVEICGGVPYRRCEYPRNSGKIGMCINNRLQVLMCMVNDDYIRLRKAQIQRKIGPVCEKPG